LGLYLTFPGVLTPTNASTRGLHFPWKKRRG